jgi:hypothetical protein
MLAESAQTSGEDDCRDTFGEFGCVSFRAASNANDEVKAQQLNASTMRHQKWYKIVPPRKSDAPCTSTARPAAHRFPSSRAG